MSRDEFREASALAPVARSETRRSPSAGDMRHVASRRLAPRRHCRVAIPDQARFRSAAPSVSVRCHTPRVPSVHEPSSTSIRREPPKLCPCRPPPTASCDEVMAVDDQAVLALGLHGQVPSRPALTAHRWSVRSRGADTTEVRGSKGASITGRIATTRRSRSRASCGW